MITETLTACPICQSPSITARRPSNKPASKCQSCGQVFLNPRMTDAQTAEYYRGAYRDLVSNASSGFNEADISTQKTRAKLQYMRIKPFIGSVKTCLEIGSSLGYLMRELAERGVICTGIEPDTRYHTVVPSSKFDVYRDISEVPLRHFDLFTLSHSLEHLNHPLEYLRNLIDNYSSGEALIMVEVPNYAVYTNTLSQHHPFAFDQRSLDVLMARLNYRPVMTCTHNLEYNERGLFLIGLYGVDDGY